MAFIAASAADAYGNCTGQTGANPCGSLGYSFVDAQNAGKVIVITDTLVEYPCVPVSISQQYVDYVVSVERIRRRFDMALLVVLCLSVVFGLGMVFAKIT